jgi:acetyl esterase/lipase
MFNLSTAPKLQAHHVSISEYRADSAKYTAAIPPGPKPKVGSVTVYNVPVSQPSGEIMVQVYKPTDEAISLGGFDNPAGLPAHINYHGGELIFWSSSRQNKLMRLSKAAGLSVIWPRTKVGVVKCVKK